MGTPCPPSRRPALFTWPPAAALHGAHVHLGTPRIAGKLVGVPPRHVPEGRTNPCLLLLLWVQLAQALLGLLSVLWDPENHKNKESVGLSRPPFPHPGGAPGQTPATPGGSPPPDKAAGSFSKMQGDENGVCLCVCPAQALHAGCRGWGWGARDRPSGALMETPLCSHLSPQIPFQVLPSLTKPMMPILGTSSDKTPGDAKSDGHTWAHTGSHTNTGTHPGSHPGTHTHKHTRAHAGICKHTQVHTQTHPGTPRYTQAHTDSHTNTQAPMHTLRLSDTTLCTAHKLESPQTFSPSTPGAPGRPSSPWKGTEDHQCLCPSCV